MLAYPLISLGFWEILIIVMLVIFLFRNSRGVSKFLGRFRDDKNDSRDDSIDDQPNQAE